MLLTIFLRGVLIGLMASIPLGPIGVLCIQRTLSKRQKSGFISGLGAASADVIFASIAFFSLSVVMSFIDNNKILIQVLGGICVVILGVSIFLTNPAVQIRRNRAGKSNLWQDYISVFFITLANPAFILMFVALFATFGVSNDILGVTNGVAMIIGVFFGGSIWWFILTFVVNMLRKKFRPRHLLWINRISGTVIVVLGAATVLLTFVKIPVNGILN